jgi:hypothetical protein
MTPTLIKLKGIVTNGERVYDRPEMKKMVLDELEGKRFEEIIKKEHIAKTDQQLAYYFGGIISGTCMRNEMFGGWSKDDVDHHLRSVVCAYKEIRIVNGKPTITERVDSLSEYNVDQMVLFLEGVLQYLSTMDIVPLPPNEYELKKYQPHARP